MNNNKKTITICSIIALIILAIVVVVTLISDLTSFSIVFGAFFVVLTICLTIYLREEPDEFNAFVKNKKRILRTYDSVIVEVEDIPNIAGKNIIKVKSIEDLVDAQLELREPIYYKNDNDSCFFLLLHYNEACIYVLRMNDSVVSPTEQSIRYMKEENVDKTKEQENILENLEKTVVYKLDELRSFRISPIRNNEKINVVDDTAIKKEIESSKEQDITSSALSSELSKTMYLKDLRERMLKYEEEQNAKTSELKAIKEEVKNAIEEETVAETAEKVDETPEKEPELSPLDRLRKMVKEQEQELTKELKIKTPKEESEEEEIEETIDEVEEQEEIVEETPIEEPKKEEIKLEVVESTGKKEEIKPVTKEENEEDKKFEEEVISYVKDNTSITLDNDEDDFMNGIVVLHSLDDDPVSEPVEDEEIITGPITINDDILEPKSKIAKVETDIELNVVEETSEEKISEVAETVEEEDKVVEEAIEEEEETVEEPEIEETTEETPEEPVEQEEKKEPTKEVSKPRRNTKPRKVTHSTRRAQKHVNSRTKR